MSNILSWSQNANRFELFLLLPLTPQRRVTMKKLNVILFKNESENEKYSDAICQKLSSLKFSADQEFCGIWGEIQFNKEECLKAISSTVNFALSSDKNDIYFGCSQKDYEDIISLINCDNCEVSIVSCADI